MLVKQDENSTDSKITSNSTDQRLDSIPGIGHIRACVFYARNEPERASTALMAANRTSLVVAGAVIGSRFGTVGSKLGSWLGGAAADAVHSILMNSPQGTFILIMEVWKHPSLETVWNLAQAICLDTGIGDMYSIPITKLIEYGPNHAWLKVKSMTIKEMNGELNPYMEGLVLVVKLVREQYQPKETTDNESLPQTFSESSEREVGALGDIQIENPSTKEPREIDFPFYCVCFKQKRQCPHFKFALKQYFEEFEAEINGDFY